MQRKLLEQLAGKIWGVTKFVHHREETDITRCLARVSLNGDEAAVCCENGQPLFSGQWSSLNIEEYPGKVILVYPENKDLIELVLSPI